MPTAVKISELPTLSNVLANDILPIVDSGLTQTHKCTASQIAALGGGPPGANTVNTTHLQDGAVTAAKCQFTGPDKLFSRTASGAGSGVEIACTSYARGLLATSSGAAARAYLDALQSTNDPTFTGAIRAGDGSAIGPSYTFSSDTDTGLYRSAENTLSVTTNGTEDFRFNGDGSLSSLVPGTSTMLPHFGVRAWVNFDGTANSPSISGSYSRSGTTVTVTATAHGLQVGQLVFLDFTSGTAVDTQGTVTSVADANTFTITHGTSGTTSGNVTVSRVFIRASGNVSSVIDWGSPNTGRYAINFTTAMPDTNYAVLAFARDVQTNTQSANNDGAAANLAAMNWNGAKTTQYVQMLCAYAPYPALFDTTEYNVLVIR